MNKAQYFLHLLTENGEDDPYHGLPKPGEVRPPSHAAEDALHDYVNKQKAAHDTEKDAAPQTKANAKDQVDKIQKGIHVEDRPMTKGEKVRTGVAATGAAALTALLARDAVKAIQRKRAAKRGK